MWVTAEDTLRLLKKSEENFDDETAHWCRESLEGDDHAYDMVCEAILREREEEERERRRRERELRRRTLDESDRTA